MLRPIVILVLAGALEARAQPAPQAAPPGSPAGRAADVAPEEPPAGYAIEQPRRLDSLGQKELEREMLQQQWSGPSGFWTSPHKSKHGAYRWRMLGIGLVLMAITGVLTLRLIRRTPPPRAGRGLPSAD